MPLSNSSVGEQLSLDFRNKMRDYYLRTEAIKETLMSQPYLYHSNAKMAAVKKELLAELGRVEREAQEYAATGMVRAYKQGLATATGKPAKTTIANTRKLLGAKPDADNPFNGVQGDFEKHVAAAIRTQRASIAQIDKQWRVTNREIVGTKSVAGAEQLITRRRNAMRRGFLPAALTSATRFKYVSTTEGGSKRSTREGIEQEDATTTVRWRFGSYMNMLALRHTQAAYNQGLIQGFKEAKVKTLRIHDGPGCGLRNHRDTQKANGMLVNLRDASRYSLSHPNCIRTFHPVSDLPEPPDQESKAHRESKYSKTRLTQDAKDYAAAYARIAQVASREFVVNMVKDSAGYFISDLFADQQLRRGVISAVVRNHPRLRTIDDRMTGLVKEIGARARALGKREPTEHQVHEAAEEWMNRWLENPDIAMPKWAQRAVFGQLNAVSKKVVGGESLAANAQWFDVYRDLKHRQGLTHNDLNVMNSINSAYSEQMFTKLASTFFDNTNEVARVASRIQRRFAPDNKIAEDAAKRLGEALRGTVYDKLLKRPGDKALETLFPFTDRMGNVKIVRTSNRDFDLRHMGLRYAWNTRPIKVQTTLVNRFKYMASDALRASAREQGVAVSESYKATAFGKYAYDAVRYRSRKAVLDEIGYSAGLLTRITLKPHELVRLGFRWDPGLGWRKPLPQLSLSTPQVGQLTLRTNLRLNKGWRFGNPLHQGSRNKPFQQFMRQPNFTVKNGVPTIRPRPVVTPAMASAVDGVRVRNVTQEVVLAFGDTFNLNKYVSPKSQLGKMLIPKIPTIGSVGLRAGTFVGRMESMADAKHYLRTVGVKGFYEDMAVISWFGELRHLGFNWFHIGKIVGLSVDDVPKVAMAFNKVWGGFRVESGLATLLSRAYAVRTIPGVKVDDVAKYIERYMALYDKKYPAGDAMARQRELRRIRKLILNGGDV